MSHQPECSVSDELVQERQILHESRNNLVVRRTLILFNNSSIARAQSQCLFFMHPEVLLKSDTVVTPSVILTRCFAAVCTGRVLARFCALGYSCCVRREQGVIKGWLVMSRIILESWPRLDKWWLILQLRGLYIILSELMGVSRDSHETLISLAKVSWEGTLMSRGSTMRSHESNHSHERLTRGSLMRLWVFYLVVSWNQMRVWKRSVIKPLTRFLRYSHYTRNEASLKTA